MALANNGTASYNSISFLMPSFKSRVTAKPIYDDSNRTVKWVEYTVQIRAYVTAAAGSTTDTTIESYRRRLTTAGGAFAFTDKGYGSLVANVDNATRDVNWGPKPELLNLVSVGASNAILADWTCVVCLPECSSATYMNGIAQFNREVSFEIADDGYQTITTNISVEIPMTRTAGSMVAPDNADYYRERATPRTIEGFKRTQSWRLSKNSSRLEGTIVDTQLPVPLPDGVAAAEITHTMKSNFPHVMASGTISGSIRMGANEPRSAALTRFQQILATRLPIPPGDNGNPWVIKEFNGGSFQAQERIMFMPENLSISEQVFDRATNFTYNYRLVGLRRLEALLVSSNLWRPIAGTNHARWNTSMLANDSFKAHGASAVGASNADDVIIDLCNNRAPQVPHYGPGTDPAPGEPDAGASSVQGQISPEVSWVQYTSGISLVQYNGAAIHKPLLPPQRLELPIFVEGDGSNPRGALSSSDLPGSDTPATQQDIVQQAQTPEVWLVLHGWAHRLGYAIDPPQLVSVAGVRVVEIHRWIHNETVAVLGGIVPLIRTDWRIYYRALGPIPKLCIPSNLMFQTPTIITDTRSIGQNF